MKWEPRKTAAALYEKLRLDIAEPPCKVCKYWNPRIKTDSYGAYAGVICCTNSDMWKDFSCYRPEEESTQ